MSELNRREFVIAAAVATAACACGSESALGGDPLPPRGPLDVGAINDFSGEGVVDRFARSNRVLLIRRGDRLYAPTATCSHKGCAVKSVNGEIRCPCHGARYSLDGTVTKGPARDSLPRYAISVNADGRVIVDTSRTFGEKDWDDPASFIKV